MKTWFLVLLVVGLSTALKVELHHDRIRAELKNILYDSLSTLLDLSGYFWPIVINPFRVELHNPKVTIDPAQIALQTDLQFISDRVILSNPGVFLRVSGLLTSKPLLAPIDIDIHLHNIFIELSFGKRVCDFGSCLKLLITQIDYEIKLNIDFPGSLASYLSKPVSSLVQGLIGEYLDFMKEPEFLELMNELIEDNLDGVFPFSDSSLFTYDSSLVSVFNEDSYLALEINGMLELKSFQFYPDPREEVKMRLPVKKIVTHDSSLSGVIELTEEYVNKLIARIFPQLPSKSKLIPLENSFLWWLDVFGVNDNNFLRIEVIYPPRLTMKEEKVSVSCVLKISYVTKKEGKLTEIDHEFYFGSVRMKIDTSTGKYFSFSHDYFSFNKIGVNAKSKGIIEDLVNLHTYVPDKLVQIALDYSIGFVKLVDIKGAKYEVYLTELKRKENKSNDSYLIKFDFNIDGKIADIEFRELIAYLLELELKQ